MIIIIIIIIIINIHIVTLNNVFKDHSTAIVTRESYDSFLVGTRKQKGLESLSENRD